ncbi:hypothetical protein D3C86_1994090 [compost metagenome]
MNVATTKAKATIARVVKISVLRVFCTGVRIRSSGIVTTVIHPVFGDTVYIAR